jgi:hypothetical protein
VAYFSEAAPKQFGLFGRAFLQLFAMTRSTLCMHDATDSKLGSRDA